MWKDVRGYEGRYKVSDDGRIFSEISQKELKPNLLKSGYFQFSLSKNGKRQLFLGHRIVAETFISNPENLPIINHKNEDKTDNRAENLEWCTYSYNMTYGKMKEIFKRRSHWEKGAIASRKPVEQIKNNLIIHVYSSITEAHEKTGINISNISQCCKGNRKTAGNYEWRFKEGKHGKAS